MISKDLEKIDGSWILTPFNLKKRLFLEMAQPGKNAKVDQIRRDVDEVTGIMSANVNQQIDNMAKTEDLERQTQDLADQSFTFKKRSKQIRCQMCLENWKMGAVIFGLVAIVILIIVVALSN